MKHFFPRIVVNRAKRGHRAEFALEMKSILHGHLAKGNAWSEGPLDARGGDREAAALQKKREAFLLAIGSWPADVCLELHMTSLPDPMHGANARFVISLFVSVQAGEEEEAKERAAARYLALKPLLSAHFPEAEFVPVIDREAFDTLRSPFFPGHAVSLHRRCKDLPLAIPLSRRVAGFGSGGEEAREPAHVVSHTYPWTPTFDDWSLLVDALLYTLDPVKIIVRLRPVEERGPVREGLRKDIRTYNEFLRMGKENHVTLDHSVTMLRDITLDRHESFSQACFKVGVFLLAPFKIDTSLVNIVGGAITARKTVKADGRSFQGDFSSRAVTVEKALDNEFFHSSFPFTAIEAACAFRLPSPPLHDRPGLPVRRARTSCAVLPRRGKPGEETRLFLNEHAGMSQPVTLSADDRMRHLFIIGQTGTGKSTLMESLILQDIRAGRGVGLIDPHGDLVQSILSKMPESRKNDVVLFDVLDREEPAGFNILAYESPEERDLIIEELYLTLDRIYDMKATGGPIFEANLRGMLRLLMPDAPRPDFTPTILEFPLCYLNHDFRKWLIRSMRDQHASDFIEELERAGGESSISNVAPYITSKVNRFLFDSTLRRIVGQEKTAFSFDEIVNGGKIFLVNLGKGRFGAQVSAMLANQLVSRLRMAAMKRGGMKGEERRDFFLYVDEAQTIPPDDMMLLLGEARKFRLGLVLATQHASQIAGQGTAKNSLLSSVLGNVGTLAVFRVGHEDAKLLAPALHPYFSEMDLLGLPNWQGFARMQTSRDTLPPFSFTSPLDPAPADPDLAERIRGFSRAACGMDAQNVDEQIARRRSLYKEKGEADANAK